MKLLPAAWTKPKLAPKKKGSEISTVTAVALSLLAIVIVFVIGEAYLTQVRLTMDERSAFLNTLLLCDVIAFGISLLVTVILWHWSSIAYGSRDSIIKLGSGLQVFLGSLMLLPVVFIACDLAFQPLFFSQVDVEIALALSLIGIWALAPYSINVLELIKPRGILLALIEDIRKEFDAAGMESPMEPVALQKPVLRGSAGNGLASLLDRLCRSGDHEPVLQALGEMSDIALEAVPQDGLRPAALSSSMVSLMAETACMAARHGSLEVLYGALDDMKTVAVSSSHPGIASLAFRSMGGVFNFCATCMDERALSRLETKLMEEYSSVYDRAGRHEALEMAAAMAEKAAGSKMFVTEEYDGMLYVSGGVYRRLAEADDSEEYANKALTVLYEALTARTVEASPMDHACIKGEIGKAYLALARIKNPVKSYRSAATAFEEAGKMLDAKVAPWDSAFYHGKAACAFTMLADEYCRARRYDDALQAARSALALYPEAIKFFAKRSPEDHVETLSNLGFAHTIVGEVYLKSRMFDLSLKHAGLALDAYSSATKAIDANVLPERYAFLKTSMGLTHVNMAEIHFREKRYENAIGSCDSAIAAYNEAIRIYDERKKDKPASSARKHLKKANDLFNTMMRIGVADRKPMPIEVEQ